MTSTGEDLYAVLDIPSDATREEVRRAYRALARTLHPDVCSDASAAKRFAKIAHAHAVLSDHEQRKIYDAMRVRPIVDFEDEPPEARDIFETFNASRGKGFADRRRTRGSS